MWYPNESFDERPLQISFFLDQTADEYVHETKLGETVEQRRESANVSSEWAGTYVALDGSVSVNYRGRELLGPTWWIEFISMTSLHPLIHEDEQVHQSLDQSSYKSLRIAPSENGVSFKVTNGDKTVTHETLHRDPFVREWLLMGLRVDRLRAELGDAGAQQRLSKPLTALTEQSRAVVGDDLILYTLEESLTTVLARPIPVIS